MVYDYNSKIPLAVKVEMHPSGFPNLGAEELAEVRYSIDGQPENNASIKNEVNSKGYGMDGYADATLSGLSKGAHRLFVRGHTSFGNFSSQAVSFNRTICFIVDTVSAAIEVVSPQQTTYNSITVSVKFKSYKPLVWAGYSLDQKMVVDCLNGANITYLSNGVHSLRIYGTDSSGNTYASQSAVFLINGKSPPVVTLDIEKMVNDRPFVPPDVKNETWWHLVFHVNEPTSWLGYSVDWGANETIGGNTYLHLSYGQHTVIVYAADLCGNIGASTPYTFTVGPGEAGSVYSPIENSTSTAELETSEPEQETFPWLHVVAIVSVAALVAASVVVYLKKRKHSA